jgi:hypothetical protein
MKVTTINFDNSQFNDLPLPGGRTVKAEPRLHSLIVDDLSVPGTHHHMGRAELLSHYAAHLDTIRAKGAQSAVDSYLATAAEKLKR